MDAPITLAERARINAENRAKYEAMLADKAAHQAARKAELRERRLQKAGMDSCGSVEQTGNPRSGCACEKCGFRRAEKSANQRARRHGEELPKVKTEAILEQERGVSMTQPSLSWRDERYASYGLMAGRLVLGQDTEVRVLGGQPYGTWQ